MEPNAVIYLTLPAARTYENKPDLEGREPFRYAVVVQRIEPTYVVIRVSRSPDAETYNVLYLPWYQVIGIEMAEGISHHLLRHDNAR